MSIVRIVADIDCDECGKRYQTSLDEGAANVFDAAVNGKLHNRPLNRDGGGLFVSYEDGKMLCQVCTEINDEKAQP